LAKFHAETFNRSENIPKSFRGGYFFEDPVGPNTIIQKINILNDRGFYAEMNVVHLVWPLLRTVSR